MKYVHVDSTTSSSLVGVWVWRVAEEGAVSMSSNKSSPSRERESVPSLSLLDRKGGREGEREGGREGQREGGRDSGREGRVLVILDNKGAEITKTNV